ncbi:folic acid Hypothetical protein [Nesidiocoris tenuis]|uniref:Uncharacterized protein n=1 Tax=Nesidiocoris tenuis TaxID=355587 RepID=A0ABN7B014_9HEMI|nr:folic acid Hypothetical protein [Nesidiocoris tenuis]
MEPWVKITLLLSVYGILKEIRPSEPFITEFLTHPPMNFTEQQVVEDIYPVSVYATFTLSVVIFLITDLVRYKPIIVLLSASATAVYAMLVFGRTLFIMQVLEVFYGLFTACEVAYYSYIYAKVDRTHYQEVTGYTRSAYLLGRSVSGIISQTLIWTGFSYLSLNVVTLGTMCISGVWALFLPPVDSSIYFNPRETDPLTGATVKRPMGEKMAHGFRQLWKDFITAFSSPYVIKWAFWWALATCCYYQILEYVQTLWKQILRENPQKGGDWNGAVETSYTLISAAGAYGFGRLQVDWAKYGELVLCVGSLVNAGLLYIMAQTPYIFVAYATKILYALIYNSIMTITNSEVAKNINPDSYGLIFGFTTFLALLMQTILTIVVIEYLALSPRDQFTVYGGYFAVLGIVFALKSCVDLVRRSCRESNHFSSDRP